METTGEDGTHVGDENADIDMGTVKAEASSQPLTYPGAGHLLADQLVPMTRHGPDAYGTNNNYQDGHQQSYCFQGGRETKSPPSGQHQVGYVLPTSPETELAVVSSSCTAGAYLQHGSPGHGPYVGHQIGHAYHDDFVSKCHQQPTAQHCPSGDSRVKVGQSSCTFSRRSEDM
jgi:hypothetical protein